MSVKPKKSLGQHFLKDRQVAAKIADGLTAGKNDRVIEIGPGTGALTVPLSSRYPDLHVFEVDSRSADVIEKNLPDVTVHKKSFLEADPDELGRGVDGKLAVIGNLPYFLTSPILFYVIDQGNLFSQAVFMIQKEVAQRLIASPCTKEYGILSVQAQVIGRMEVLFPVSRHVFYPPPKVESAVISWRPGNEHFPRSWDDLPVAPETFKKVVRTAFQQRRKKLSNALKPLFGTLLPEDVDLNRRAEELTPLEFVRLAMWLERNR